MTGRKLIAASFGPGFSAATRASRRAKSALPTKSASVGYCGKARPRSATLSPTTAPQLSRPSIENDNSFMRRTSGCGEPIFDNSNYFRNFCKKQVIAHGPAVERSPNARPEGIRASVADEQMRGVFLHILGRAANVALDQLYREIAVARDRGLHARAVLADLVARLRAQVRRQIAVARRPFEQRRADRQQGLGI